MLSGTSPACPQRQTCIGKRECYDAPVGVHSAWNWTFAAATSSCIALAPSTAAADVTTQIDEPITGDVFAESVNVRATIASDFQLTSVVAELGGVQQTLIYDSFWHYWTGTLSTVGVPSGTYTLTVVATDAFNDQDTDQIVVDLDRRPTLTVSSPPSGAVADPNILIEADCADDFVCSTIEVRVSGTVVASGAPPFSSLVSLAAYEDQDIILRMNAVDSIGQPSELESRTISVETGECLAPLAVVDGEILDWDETRVLFTVENMTGIFDLATQQITASTPSGPMSKGFLTPVGAIFSDGTVLELRGTTLGDHGPGPFLHAAGDWAVWVNDGLSFDAIFLYDVVAGAGSNPDTNAYLGDLGGIVVGPNADIVYKKSAGAGSWSACRKRLAADPECFPATGATGLSGPITDGINVAFLTVGLGPNYTQNVYLVTPTGTETLSQAQPWGVNTKMHGAGGWVGFSRWDGLAAAHASRRSPLGVEEQLAFFSTTSTVEAIADDGDTLLRHDDVRYRADPPNMPIPMCTPLGIPKKHGDYWELAIGNTLFTTDLSSSTGGMGGSGGMGGMGGMSMNGSGGRGGMGGTSMSGRGGPGGMGDSAGVGGSAGVAATAASAATAAAAALGATAARAHRAGVTWARPSAAPRARRLLAPAATRPTGPRQRPPEAPPQTPTLHPRQKAMAAAR